MDELEPQRAPPELEGSPSPPEPWSPLWSWIVRVLGVAIMVQQTWFEQEDRQWLLLCAMGCLLGEIGAKSALRFMLRNGGGGQ